MLRVSFQIILRIISPSTNKAAHLSPYASHIRLRRTTYDRLLLFTGGEMTSTLKSLTSDDLLFPILTDEHYLALERRLLKLFKIIEFCHEKHGSDMFR